MKESAGLFQQFDDPPACYRVAPAGMGGDDKPGPFRLLGGGWHHPRLPSASGEERVIPRPPLTRSLASGMNGYGGDRPFVPAQGLQRSAGESVPTRFTVWSSLPLTSVAPPGAGTPSAPHAPRAWAAPGVSGVVPGAGLKKTVPLSACPDLHRGRSSARRWRGRRAGKRRRARTVASWALKRDRLGSPVQIPQPNRLGRHCRLASREAVGGEGQGLVTAASWAWKKRPRSSPELASQIPDSPVVTPGAWPSFFGRPA